MTVTSYPLLQFVFYGSTTVAQSLTYGTAEVMANSSNVSLSMPKNGGPSVVVTGIIEGPLPMPDANIIGWQFEGTNNDLGSLVYGTSNSQNAAVQQSFNVGVSLTSQGQIGIWGGAEYLATAERGRRMGFFVEQWLCRTWQHSSGQSSASTAQQPSMVNVVTHDKNGGQPVTSQVGQGIVPSGSLCPGRRIDLDHQHQIP